MTDARGSDYELHEQREWLRATLFSIGDAVITTDTEGRVTFVNPVAESLTGWPHADANSQPLETVFRIVNRETHRTVESPTVRAMRDGVVAGLANLTLLICKDGTERPIDYSAAPIRDERNGNEVAGVVLIFREITERYRLERAVQDSLTFADNIIATLREPFLVLDRELRVVTANRSFYENFHVALEETQGRFIYDLGNRQWDIPKLRSLLEEVLPQNYAFDDFLVEHDFPNIGRKMMLLNARRVYREDDCTELILLAFEDTTDRMQAEMAHRENEQQFRTLVGQVKDYAIFVFDTAGRPTSWNEGVKQVLGFEEAEFIGKDIVPIIFTPEDVRNGVPQAELEEAAATGTSGNDRWMRRKDGTRIFAMGVTTGLLDDAGKLVGFIKVMRDQTEQKRLEEELQRIAADLSEANRRKTEFLAMLGHELRNPLAPIRTGLEVLKTVADDPVKAEEIRSMMERQAQQLVRLIDDLLDVSRITQGKLQLRMCQVVLTDVVESAVEASRPFLDEAGHELTLALPSQPIYLEADPNRLAQVISNLLNNSTKYTPEGGHVWLTVERHGTDVTIRVKDNGIGIPTEMQVGIFELFAQIDRPLEKSYKGLGIGLTLVKRLVEMHGGRVEVHSEGPNKGSEFSVQLPILLEPNVAQPQAVQAETATRKTTLRALVVDDNTAAADMLGMVVKMLGNEVRIAYNGSQAVEVAEEFRPDVVLMDLGMPKMNGYEAAKHIREQEWGKGMVLVALTGWGQEEDRRRTKEAGFDHHLVKPTESAALQKLFAELEQKSE